MANHKEILRLKSLGLTHAQIAQSCECGRNTVTRTLQQAQSAGLSWSQARNMTEEEIFAKLYPKAPCSSAYQMPDYEYIHQEMQKSGVTLSLLWQEYRYVVEVVFPVESQEVVDLPLVGVVLALEH